MIKRLSTFWFFFLLCIFTQLGYAQQATELLPKPAHFVQDQAELLTEAERDQLDQDLIAFEQKTSIEFAVATVSSLGDETIETMATQLFESWKIGKKDKDNGILLLIAPQERKMRIEVGYGLEGGFPDVKANQVIKNVIAPAFKQGNFSEGIRSGVQAVMHELGSPGEVEKQADSSGSKGGSFFLFFLIGVVALSKLLQATLGKRTLVFMLYGVVVAVVAAFFFGWFLAIFAAIFSLPVKWGFGSIRLGGGSGGWGSGGGSSSAGGGGRSGGGGSSGSW